MVHNSKHLIQIFHRWNAALRVTSKCGLNAHATCYSGLKKCGRNPEYTISGDTSIKLNAMSIEGSFGETLDFRTHWIYVGLSHFPEFGQRKRRKRTP